jgi:hypothetical protein
MTSESFGANVEGVLAHVRSLGLDVERVQFDVERWMEDAAARVVSRVGHPEGWAWADPDGTLLALGRASIHFGAASLLFDSTYPERALTTEGDTSYGTVLWTRHNALLFELAEALEASLRRRTPLVGPDAGTAGTGAGTMRVRGPSASP